MDVLPIPYSPIKSINTKVRLNHIKKKYKINGVRYIKPFESEYIKQESTSNN